MVSEQLRRIALSVCDRVAVAEAAAAEAADSLPVVVSRLDDDGLQELLASAAELRSETDALITASAGVVAKRSERALGYAGLAARKGHRSPVAMIQAITGSSRGEASRQVRLGEAMGEADAAVRLAGIDTGTGTGAATGLDPVCGDSAVPSTRLPEPPAPPRVALPWFEPVTRAVAEHTLTSELAAAIIRGMGQPCGHCDAETMREAAGRLLESLARLAAERPGNHYGVNADEAAKLARQQRDRIDPVGVSERFQKHYEDRAWRFNRTASGQRTAWVQFDDESAAWIDAIVSAGMRPRRGGPRFVDPAERARAEALVADPRSNDQLVFDLLMDTLRAGAIADPTTAFGTRQPGLRVIIQQDQLDQRDSESNLTGTGFLEDTGQAVAPQTLERMLCDIGTRPITVDPSGNPLDVGREQRLFTTKQHIAMAYRDGGCMDPFCDQPSSYTEAHHINHWAEHHGKTDIADGIQLCRNSHMRVHNQGWKIRREGSVYWMIPPKDFDPQQTPIRMRSKAPWRQTNTG